MKNFKRVALIAAVSTILISGLSQAGSNLNKGGWKNNLNSNLVTNSEENNNQTVSVLDDVEASHLQYMREEEKLARDLYLTLYEMYPRQKIFYTIATRSEQKHTDIMEDRLNEFNVEDPNPYTNNLPYSIGEFLGNEWGHHFTEVFDELVSKASLSELDALYVGALVEEEDIKEIVTCPDIMVESGYPASCGLNYTDENSLQKSYASLLDGSKNHLRSYVKQIEKKIGVGNYKAQSLSQEDVDAILDRM